MKRVLIFLMAVVLVFPLVITTRTNTSAAAVLPYQADYEYGFSLGQQWKQLYRLVLDISWKPFNLVTDDPLQAARKHVEALQKYYPEQLARLQGLSDAIEIDLLKVVAASIYLPPLFLKGCTTSASAPPATKDGEVFLTWNLDLWPFWGLKQLVVTIPPLSVVSPPEKNSYIIFGIPLIAGIGLLNEEGLALVGNACGTTDCGDGLTAVEIPNMIMERCSTVKEAAEFIGSVDRFSSSGFALFNLNYLWADAEGGIATVEATHRYFTVAYSGSDEYHFEYVNGEVVKTKGEMGILAQGNHHQYLNYNETGAPSSESDGYQSSWIRCARMWDLLRENYGNIGLEKVMSFTGDIENGAEILGKKRGGYNSICRTEFPIGWIDYYIGSITHKYVHTGKPAWFADLYILGPDNTDATIVVQPKERIIWWAAGRSTKFAFHPIYCADLLGVEGPSPSSSDGIMTTLMNGGVKLFTGAGGILQLFPSSLTTFLSDLVVKVLKTLAHGMEHLM